MLLRRIEVENFRGLRSAVLEFDATTVLIGENSAGKTTLLDAVAICCAGRGDTVTIEVRDFHQRGTEPPAESLRIALLFQETDGDWGQASWEAFRPLVQADASGVPTIGFEVHALRDPETNAVQAEWRFGNGHADLAGQRPGLLAEWRRLAPMLRLRANRYFEQDVRSAPPAPRADIVSADPVARQLEQQIRLVYDRLTGASDIQEDELLRGLDAAEEYMALRTPYRRAGTQGPPALVELADTPLGSWRRPDSLLPTIKQGRGARGLAMVALIGALLDARQRQALEEESHPLLVLEDVEAHLHPTTLSSMWELITTLPAQKIVTTNSGELLAAVPLRSVRRLVTDCFGTRVHKVDGARYTVNDIRRIAYHVRVNRATALFARCWVFVEGETEAWLLPELAQLCGYDFPAEGIRCVEFAQSGLHALLRLANDFGIEWHLLTDGDEAGASYEATAMRHLRGHDAEERITRLEDRDIEHCLYFHGYGDTYRQAAGGALPAPRGRRQQRERVSAIIARAVHARSKPGLALAVLEAANQPGSPGVPGPLRSLIETAVRLARPPVAPL